MKTFQTDLSAKQQSEFRALVKLLEGKDYKKGLRNAEKLLQLVPDNGEILSLKAIFMYYNDQQTEGIALANQTLLKNLKSDFCWHIYGLIHKAQKNYIEAIKCFLQAINKGEENLQLARDTASLQLHVRDYEGNAILRHKLLSAKPNMLVNWIGYFFGQHLIGQYDLAFQGIEKTEKQIAKQIENNDQNKPKSVEVNEFKLYQIYLAIESKDYKKAQQYIHDFKKDITDLVGYYELQFDLYSKTKQIKEGEEAARELIKLQPQNWKYYQMLLQINPKQDLSEYDNSLVVGRQLALKEGENFRKGFKSFVDPFFQKSLPSLFREIIHLYKDQNKHQIMRETYEEYLTQGPIQQLWAWMMLAQHTFYLNQLDQAYEFIEKAINQTPTFPEIYLVKAKILKKQEKFQEAYQVADKARQLDLADRYLNNKAIKYALRANLIYVAFEFLRMFLRDCSNPYELQMIWFELGVGKAFLRLRNYGPALQQFYLIFKHYQEMYEDQLDFYQFSMRKYTLRSMIQMIEAMDNRYNNKYFVQTAGLMIQGLNEYSSQIKNQETQQQKKLTPNEKKKLAKLQQKLDQEKHLREQFAIEGYIFSVDLQKKYDLSGQHLLSGLKTQADITKMQNQFASVLVHTTYSNNKEINFQAFKQLAEFYINQKRNLLCLKVLIKLRQNETEHNCIVNHKYQLLLVKYCKNLILYQIVNSYQGDHINLIKEHIEDPVKFDADFWKNHKINTQLEKSIKQQCDLILADKDYQLYEESDDLEYLEEFPQARIKSKNVMVKSVNPNNVIITIITMKIAIQILILSVINLTNEFTTNSISYISLILLCLIYIYALWKQTHLLQAELLLLSNLLVCLFLFDISAIGCVIMAQKISKHNIIFLIMGINVKFIRDLNIREIIQGELILFVILAYLLKDELSKIAKKKQLQQNNQDQQEVLIEDHSQLISNTTNNLQKDFFKNFINLIPNGLLILNDEDTVIASNQQLNILFPDKTSQEILNLLQQGKNLNQEIDVEDDGLKNQFNKNQCTVSEILIQSNKDDVKSEIKEYFNTLINQGQLSQFRITRSSQMFVKLQANMINNYASEKSTIITKLPDKFYNMYLTIIFIQFLDDGQNKLMIFLKDESSFTRIKMLKKLNHNKSKMLRNVCHELRNPVSAISMIAQGMEKQLDHHIYQEFGEPIQLTTILVMNLLNDLLDVAQMNSGNFSLALSQFNLNTLLEEIKRLMQFQLRSQSVDLILNCNVQQIITDQNRLRQVIINLISNSLKFTPQGRITVNVQRQTNEIVEICVVDTGKGIVKEDQKKLFKVFSKLKSSVNLNTNGVGLGLNISQALCKKLCEIKSQNNGLQVFSEGENKGATFSFLVQDHYNSTTYAQTSQKKKSIYSLDSLRFSNCKCFEILIVDDQQFILHAAKIALSHQFLKVDTASSGIEAYDKVMTYQAFEDCGCRNYKIIFMDIEMPGMDGFTTSQKIRTDFPTEKISIYGCSGYGLSRQQQFNQSGFDGFIQKPITIEKISSIIREMKEE